MASGAGRLPDFCRSQLCTVLHSRAVCNGSDRSCIRKRSSTVLRTSSLRCTRPLPVSPQVPRFDVDRGTDHPSKRLDSIQL